MLYSSVRIVLKLYFCTAIIKRESYVRREPDRLGDLAWNETISNATFYNVNTTRDVFIDFS